MTSLQMQGALNGKTMHVVCASFVLFSLKSSTQLYSHYRTVEENSVKHVPPDGFFGIQIFPNSVSVGTRPGDSPRLPSRMGRGTPSPLSSTPSLLQRIAHRASPLFKTFRRSRYSVYYFMWRINSLFSPPPTEYITQWAAVRYR